MRVTIDAALRPLALIPARGGSKGIPGKNLCCVGGVPLVARTIRAAQAALGIGSVWVTSDDETIGNLAQQEGAGWLQRPGAIAGDHSSSEEALLHALAQLAESGPLPPIFVFLQCTSPFTTPSQIDTVLEALTNSDARMAFSVMPWHGFLWQHDANSHGTGVNHNASLPRQRRQDLPPTFLETGAIYAIQTEPFLEHRNRFVTPTLPVSIDTLSPEVDNLQDLAICNQLAPLFDGTTEYHIKAVR